MFERDWTRDLVLGERKLVRIFPRRGAIARDGYRPVRLTFECRSRDYGPWVVPMMVHVKQGGGNGEEERSSDETG